MKPAGYSGTPLAKKLGYKSDFRVLLVNEPNNYLDLLFELPSNIEFTQSRSGLFHLIHLFTKDKQELEIELPKLKDLIHKEGGMIWVSWPKKSSKVPSEVDDAMVRNTGLKTGLVDIKVCAVDQTWSGLKFVYRKKDR